MRAELSRARDTAKYNFCKNGKGTGSESKCNLPQSETERPEQDSPENEKAKKENPEPEKGTEIQRDSIGKKHARKFGKGENAK